MAFRAFMTTGQGYREVFGADPCCTRHPVGDGSARWAPMVRASDLQRAGVATHGEDGLHDKTVGAACDGKTAPTVPKRAARQAQWPIGTGRYESRSGCWQSATKGQSAMVANAAALS
jgi:hypothetical protein